MPSCTCEAALNVDLTVSYFGSAAGARGKLRRAAEHAVWSARRLKSLGTAPDSTVSAAIRYGLPDSPAPAVEDQHRVSPGRGARGLWFHCHTRRSGRLFPLMLSEWELWACANRVLQTHGDNAPFHVAEQIGALALTGDADGVRTWQGIARRIAQLSGKDGQAPPH